MGCYAVVWDCPACRPTQQDSDGMKQYVKAFNTALSRMVLSSNAVAQRAVPQLPHCKPHEQHQTADTIAGTETASSAPSIMADDAVTVTPSQLLDNTLPSVATTMSPAVPQQRTGSLAAGAAGQESCTSTVQASLYDTCSLAVQASPHDNPTQAVQGLADKTSAFVGQTLPQQACSTTATRCNTTWGATSAANLDAALLRRMDSAIADIAPAGASGTAASYIITTGAQYKEAMSVLDSTLRTTPGTLPPGLQWPDRGLAPYWPHGLPLPDSVMGVLMHGGFGLSAPLQHQLITAVCTALQELAEATKGEIMAQKDNAATKAALKLSTHAGELCQLALMLSSTGSTKSLCNSSSTPYQNIGVSIKVLLEDLGSLLTPRGAYREFQDRLVQLLADMLDKSMPLQLAALSVHCDFAALCLTALEDATAATQAAALGVTTEISMVALLQQVVSCSSEASGTPSTAVAAPHSIASGFEPEVVAMQCISNAEVARQLPAVQAPGCLTATVPSGPPGEQAHSLGTARTATAVEVQCITATANAPEHAVAASCCSSAAVTASAVQVPRSDAATEYLAAMASRTPGLLPTCLKMPDKQLLPYWPPDQPLPISIIEQLSHCSAARRRQLQCQLQWAVKWAVEDVALNAMTTYWTVCRVVPVALRTAMDDLTQQNTAVLAAVEHSLLSGVGCAPQELMIWHTCVNTILKGSSCAMTADQAYSIFKHALTSNVADILDDPCYWEDWAVTHPTGSAMPAATVEFHAGAALKAAAKAAQAASLAAGARSCASATDQVAAISKLGAQLAERGFMPFSADTATALGKLVAQTAEAMTSAVAAAEQLNKTGQAAGAALHTTCVASAVDATTAGCVERATGAVVHTLVPEVEPLEAADCPSDISKNSSSGLLAVEAAAAQTAAKQEHRASSKASAAQSTESPAGGDQDDEVEEVDPAQAQAALAVPQLCNSITPSGYVQLPRPTGLRVPPSWPGLTIPPAIARALDSKDAYIVANTWYLLHCAVYESLVDVANMAVEILKQKRQPVPQHMTSAARCHKGSHDSLVKAFKGAKAKCKAKRRPSGEKYYRCVAPMSREDQALYDLFKTCQHKLKESIHRAVGVDVEGPKTATLIKKVLDINKSQEDAFLKAKAVSDAAKKASVPLLPAPAKAADTRSRSQARGLLSNSALAEDALGVATTEQEQKEAANTDATLLACWVPRSEELTRYRATFPYHQLPAHVAALMDHSSSFIKAATWCQMDLALSDVSMAALQRLRSVGIPEPDDLTTALRDFHEAREILEGAIGYIPGVSHTIMWQGGVSPQIMNQIECYCTARVQLKVELCRLVPLKELADAVQQAYTARAQTTGVTMLVSTVMLF